MRIIGGLYKGRIFHPGKNFKSRPTTDIAREALFNILENRYDFSNKKILDLFSGTGSIGYEFISRGCQEATMVELDSVHYRFIVSVLENLKIKNAMILRTDVFKFLKTARRKYDIIFADPPYDMKSFSQVPEAVFNAGIVKDGGLFIIEHPKEYDFSGHPYFAELRKYGKVNFTFFEKPEV